MSAFTVSKELYPYLEMVFKRDHINYKTTKSPGRSLNLKVEAEIEEAEVEIVLEDAACEKQRLSEGANPFYPVYSFRTVTNAEKLARLRKHFKCGNYVILEKDAEQYKKAMGWD